jgi:hypothetical protein
MIFWNQQPINYNENPDPMEMNRFAQHVLILGAQYRGEIPNE